MMRKLIFFITVIAIFGLINISFAATILLHEDFEAGLNWKYSDKFDLYASYLEDEWDIVSTDSRSGTYCAQSKEPCDPGGIDCGWITDSTFHTTLSADAGEIFLRFWMKCPVDWQHEATDENGGANFLRAGTGSGGDWADGMEYNPGWLHIYYGQGGWPPTRYYKDNLWHEYAFYWNYSEGTFVLWEDPDGEYTVENSVAHYNNIIYAQRWTHLLLPNYYKGPVENANWTFWMDDIEIWDGIPNLTSDATAPIAPQGLSVK